MKNLKLFRCKNTLETLQFRQLVTNMEFSIISAYKVSVTRDDGLKFVFKREEIQKAVTASRRNNSFISGMGYEENIDYGKKMAETILKEWSKPFDYSVDVNIPKKTLPFQELLERSPWYNDLNILEAACITIANKPGEEPLWLMLVAPPSCGKTRVAKLVNSPLHSLRISTMTSNALSPGSARTSDVEDQFFLLEALKNKCLIIDDLSAIMGLDSRTMKKILGELTVMYGDEFSKVSPGGIQTHSYPWNFLYGLTPLLLQRHRNTMTVFGQRNLIKKFGRPSEILERAFFVKDEIPAEKWTPLFTKCVIEARERNPDVETALRSRLYDACDQITELRSWMNKGAEGINRLYKQGLNCCKTRAALHNRDVNLSDIDFFIDLALPTIPWYELINSCRGLYLVDIQKSITGKLSSIQNSLLTLTKKDIINESASGRYHINDKYWVLKPEAKIKVDDSLTGLIELENKIENSGFLEDE
jgi:hypothetical protein